MVNAMTKLDEWIAVEHTREALDDIRQRLRKGAKGSGAVLDDDECLKMCACLKKSANGRPRKTDPLAVLKAGAQGPGATLDANQCRAALARLKTPLFPKGQPPGNDYAFIRLYCFKLERELGSVEAAVKATADAWRCSVATVYAARAARSSRKPPD